MSAPDLSTSFYDAWVAMAQRLGVDPFDVARVAFAETGMYQRATDPRSNAGGIFPFMPSTLRGLGWTGTPEQFRELSPEEQIPYVERYLRPHAGYLKNDGLVYTATFTPKYLADASRNDDSFVLARAGSSIYDQNKILDRSGDGSITVGDLRVWLDERDKGARWETIASELRARGAGGGGGGGGGQPVLAAVRQRAVPLMLAAAAGAAWYFYLTAEGARTRRRAETRVSRLLAL